MKFQIDVKVMPGERCVVQNYRTRTRRWECGTVNSVKAILIDGFFYLQYWVMLDRRGTSRTRMFPEGGRPIFVTVGDSTIERKEEQ